MGTEEKTTRDEAYEEEMDIEAELDALFDYYGEGASDDTDASDSMRLYMNDIAKTRLLTAKEEAELAQMIEQGDAKAKELLTTSNLKLVVSIAKHYTGCGVQMLDLIQEGNLGLMKAVEKFDYRKGFKFSTYATWWITQGITRSIYDSGKTIRIPVHAIETMNKIRRAARDLMQETGKEPTPRDIAEKLGIPEIKVSHIMAISADPLSLDCPINEDGDSFLGDIIVAEDAVSPEDEVATQMLKKHVREALEVLNDREREIIELRFGLRDNTPRTLEYVGEQFNITRERVRQIEGKALKKLRLPGRRKKLEGYIETRHPLAMY